MLGEERKPSFLDTHPATPDRVRKTAERAETLTRAPGTPIAPTRATFLGRIEGIVVGADPAQGLFEKEKFAGLHVSSERSCRSGAFHRA